MRSPISVTVCGGTINTEGIGNFVSPVHRRALALQHRCTAWDDGDLVVVSGTTGMFMYREVFEQIVAALPSACRAVYGARLKSLALFGSVARGTMRPHSDIDLLMVVEALSEDVVARRTEFDQVEEQLESLLAEGRKEGVHTFLAAIIKTPAEMRAGSFLHLDLTDQARILYDPEHVFRSYLDDLSAWLKAMGARRVYKGGGYCWVLKPDYRPGDRIEL